MAAGADVGKTYKERRQAEWRGSQRANRRSRFSQAGDTEMMVEAGIDMGVALFLAICHDYMLLSMLLESAIHSLAIISTVPLALIGILVSLAITGKTLNIFSVMGTIMLVGIVVNNGI